MIFPSSTGAFQLHWVFISDLHKSYYISVWHKSLSNLVVLFNFSSNFPTSIGSIQFRLILSNFRLSNFRLSNLKLSNFSFFSTVLSTTLPQFPQWNFYDNFAHGEEELVKYRTRRTQNRRKISSSHEENQTIMVFKKVLVDNEVFHGHS